MILYTSGTTGRPKGAVLTHANLTFNTMNQLAHADVLSTDTALCVSPLFHATGLGQVSLPTLFKGGTNVFRGYWGRLASTRAAFDHGWYRSGDVVRWTPTGGPTWSTGSPT